MEIRDLKGKIIQSVERMKTPNRSDEDVLRFIFDDGTSCDVVAQHDGQWDESAKDEYANFIYVEESDSSLVPVNVESSRTAND
jgi:hypothetical protein